MRVVATIEDPSSSGRFSPTSGSRLSPAPRPPPSDLFDWS